MSITDRAQTLLTALVQHYLHNGQPVGSRTLAQATGLPLSPATIRHVMADLEDKGYLIAPHTSAGRIPTRAGLRFYVDSLITTNDFHSADLNPLPHSLNPETSVSSLLDSTSSLLSDLTHLVGLVSLPKRDIIQLRHIEFLPLSDQKVLVIIVLNDQDVQNCIIATDRAYTASELQQAANYLNDTYAGKDLFTIRSQLLAAMQDDHFKMNQMMQAAIEVANKSLANTSHDDYVLTGQSNLLGLTAQTDRDAMRSLFEAFHQKQGLLHLLDQCIEAEGIHIFIGEESGHAALDDCSVVTSTYAVDGQTVGVLGVIGPQRMQYDQVISIVDVTAKLLGQALSEDVV